MKVSPEGRDGSQESDAGGRTTDNSATDGCIEQDEHLVITGWNDRAQQMFGWPAASMIGSRSQVLVPERSRDRHASALAHMLATHNPGPLTREITMLHRDGHEFKVEVTLTLGGHGWDQRIVAFTRDRSEQHRVEARLQDSERTFRGVIDRLDDGYFEVNLKGMLTCVNPAYCRVTGRSPDELLGTNYKHLFQDDAALTRAMDEAYRRIYATGEPLKALELTVVHSDETKRFVEDSVSLKRDARGQPSGFIGIRRDFTDRRLAAEKLRQSEERYRAILERIEDGYFEIDLSRKGRYEYVNDAFCRITGFTREELIGQSSITFFDFFDAETIQRLFDAYHRVYVTGQPLKALEYSLIAKDGSKRFVEESVTLRKDASGTVVGFMGIRRDCTVRKSAEEEIARAKEAAEAANRAKGEFLANMSHEIRTPMNGVIGMTELILATELTPYQIDCLTTVRSSAESLLTILNDILDFSKIESRRLDLEEVPFSLNDVINDTMRPLALRAQQKGLELIADVPLEVPSIIVGDPVRLGQILTNLLGNAIKFTERGHVMLTIREVSRIGGRINLDFAVSDTGIGIPSEKHATVFEAFSQGDGSTTRRFGGTGLGLAISSTLARMMGGEIEIQSAAGEGSTFRFHASFGTTAALDVPMHGSHLANFSSLTLDDTGVDRQIFESELWHCRTLGGTDDPAARRVPVAIVPTDSSLGLKILLAEDNEVNQRVARGLLEKRGHRVTVAQNGREALRALERETFDVVVMDVQMPDVGGLEATAAIRANERQTGRHVPIVAMTAHAMKGDHERCLEAGMDDYLVKPIDPRRLFEVVERNALLPARGRHVATSTAFDHAELLERVDGDEELLTELLQLFVKDCPKQLAAIREAVEHQDLVRLRVEAHGLKGAAANLAAIPVVDAAHHLEEMAAEERRDAVPEAWKRLAVEAERLLDVLQGSAISL